MPRNIKKDFHLFSMSTQVFRLRIYILYCFFFPVFFHVLFLKNYEIDLLSLSSVAKWNDPLPFLFISYYDRSREMYI